jgi:hypothetical protein
LAMRASSEDTAGDSRTSGGARCSAPSIFTCPASWVRLCLYIEL